MWLESLIKAPLRFRMTGEKIIALERKMPTLETAFQGIETFGLYLHIPFCRQICPYCPYNKTIYNRQMAGEYAAAVGREVDRYADLIGGRPVTSFYIGGGTPTTMLDSGLDRILEHIYTRFNMQCGIHMESHPNDITPENLRRIKALGIEYLSLGVEALQDRHLRTLHRPYSAQQAEAAVGRAVDHGFKCVNVDLIFGLPGQTPQEIEQAGERLVKLGVHQVAAYPLFTLPYTSWAQIARDRRYRSINHLRRRKLLRVLEGIFYAAGFERTSVWAFTRQGIDKYCSVTVPLYVGLGASGGSYLRDVFYLNTFNVAEYIRAAAGGQMPIALSLSLSERMQMAGWLYWRVYETRFSKRSFKDRFGVDFDRVYGTYFGLLSRLNLCRQAHDEIALTSDGAYWLHAVQDLFSIDYVSKLWGTSQVEPWPERIVL